MEKLNCWEVRQCGRESGGLTSDELGVCPAAQMQQFDGVNQGSNAGRFCWAVSKTLCHDFVQGTLAEKALDCMECPFYRQVVTEQRGEKLIVNPSEL